jgi:hypothetical protein
MEMGGQVGRAPACYGSSLGSNPDISQKYKTGEVSKKKEWPTLPSPPNIYRKTDSEKKYF